MGNSFRKLPRARPQSPGVTPGFVCKQRGSGSRILFRSWLKGAQNAGLLGFQRERGRSEEVGRKEKAVTYIAGG